jgi:capsular exopolysaccharide synthesis family protein
VHRLLVVVVTATTLCAAIVWLAARTPQYQATAQILVSPLAQDNVSFLGLPLLRDSGEPTRTVQTAASLIQTRSAADRAAKALGPPWTGQRVLNAIEVKPQGQSEVLDVTATAAGAGKSARVANEFAKAALAVRTEAMRRDIDTTIAELTARLRSQAGGPGARDLAARINALDSLRGGTDPTLSLSQLAAPPTGSTGAGKLVVLFLALVAGLALGSAAAVLMELSNRHLRDEDELLALYPLPILARVPRMPRRSRQSPPGGPWVMPPPVREAFRTISVQLSGNSGSGHSIMVTSATSGDGKTTSAIDLAVTMAAAGHSVILMDFDIRKPDVGRALNLRDVQPLMSLATFQQSLTEMLSEAPHLPTLSVLATGATEGDMAILEIIANRLPQLLDEAKSLADYVVLDTAPLGEVSDALRIAHAVDDLVLVTRVGNTDRTSFLGMVDLLDRSGRTALGYLVLGATQAVRATYHSYGVATPQETTGKRRLRMPSR